MKSRIINIVVMTITVLISLLVLEMALRWHFTGSMANTRTGANLMMSHPTRGFAYRPGASGWHQNLDFSIKIDINSQGLRGREIPPKSSRFRILVVGDSGTLASGVTADESLPSVLENLLGKQDFEVINGSITAYSTVQEYLFLKERGLNFKPDLVLLAFAPVNDIQTSYLPIYKHVKKTVKRPVASLDADGRLHIDTSKARTFFEKTKNSSKSGFWSTLMARSVLIQMARRAGKSVLYKKQSDPNFLLGAPFLAAFNDAYSQWGLSNADYERIWAEAWAVTEVLIMDMKRMSNEKGAKFAVAVIPSKLQVSKERQKTMSIAYPEMKFNMTRGNERLAVFSDQNSIALFDLLGPVLKARDNGEKGLYYNKFDRHMTAKSHLIVTRHLAAGLKKSGLLPLH